MTATAPILEFRDVTAGYAGSVILQDVCFSIREGETVGLIGRNGADKTATLLAVYDIPNVQGEILVTCEPVRSKAHVPTSRGVSLVPQGKRIFSNLWFEKHPARPGLRQGGQLNAQGALRALPQLGPREQPSGDVTLRRRAADAGDRPALMAGPALLMLDEPTGVSPR